VSSAFDTEPPLTPTSDEIRPVMVSTEQHPHRDEQREYDENNLEQSRRREKGDHRSDRHTYHRRRPP